MPQFVKIVPDPNAAQHSYTKPSSKAEPDHQQSSEPIFKLPLYSSCRLSSLPLRLTEKPTLGSNRPSLHRPTRCLVGKAFQMKTEKLETRTLARLTVHNVFLLSFQLLILILRSRCQIFSVILTQIKWKWKEEQKLFPPEATAPPSPTHLARNVFAVVFKEVFWSKKNGGRDQEITRRKVPISLKVQGAHTFKTHLSTVRAGSIPDLISILIPIFQLLSSGLQNYLGSAHFQECMCKKQKQTNFKVNYKT